MRNVENGIMKVIKSFLILCFVFCTTELYAATTIKVAAIDWCPQICVNEVNAGYTVDLIKRVYENSEYQLQIDIFPWSRAIKYVSEGSYDALLAPAKKEAPQLVFPQFSVGLQRMCFFTAINDPWVFSGENSLVNKQVGIAFDTSIEELNSYIKKHEKQFQFQPYHERYVAQNANKVLKGRIDTFLFTKNTTLLELKKAGLAGSIKNAGCVSKAAIYLAFTPHKGKQKVVANAVKYFDAQVERLVESGYVDKLHQQYDINLNR